MERSRDLRLICLEARFQCFVGQISGFVDCLDAIGAFLEKYWDEVHPRPFDGDATLRQNVIGGLDDYWRVIQPLHHLPLLRDKRIGQLAFRQYSVATGATPAREGETVPDLAEINRALANPENREAADAAYQLLGRASGRLDAISQTFADKAGHDYAPSFARLSEFLTQARAMFHGARPDLAPATNGMDDLAAAATSIPTGETPAGASVTMAPAPITAGAVPVSSRAEAVAALAAAEAYFAAHEPSAPALILVHQARLLVGRPLVEALQALLPDTAERAVIRFEPTLKFQIGMASMKTLSDEAARPPGSSEPASEKAFTAASRNEAAGLIAGVEGFFRSAEPSSPIPMLLAKARTYLNRDFTMILNDLIIREE
jgi:type VI secretion system protein ImpA